MSLILDDREDDGLLRQLSVFDVPVSTARLEYGDCIFEGNGPSGRVLIAYERKHLSDLAKSMTDRRLSGHQIRGMRDYYDRCSLIIEDSWRPDTCGGIEVLSSLKSYPPQNKPGNRWEWRPLYDSAKRGVSYRQLVSYLVSLDQLSGVSIHHSSRIRETAALLVAHYHWWQKRWEDHHSQELIYCRELGVPLRRGRVQVQTREPGPVEIFAAQLPGVDRKAWAVGEHFASIEDAVLADEKEWREIPGIGAVIAKQVTAWIRERRIKPVDKQSSMLTEIAT